MSPAPSEGPREHLISVGVFDRTGQGEPPTETPRTSRAPPKLDPEIVRVVPPEVGRWREGVTVPTWRDWQVWVPERMYCGN